MPQVDRRLSPIVSLDVVGYSRLVEHDERQTFRIIRRAYQTLIEATIGESGGKVFKTMGDGLLAEFGSVISAVEWVADLQKTLKVRAIRVPGGGTLQIRAGIVLADVLVTDGDLFGNGVNLAVRVQSIAPPGGMAITKWMYEYLGGRLDLNFIDIGPTELKNLPKTVRIYVWHPDGEARVPKPKPAPLPEAVPSARPSVVVLPFDNLSGEADQAYFADAVVEEITATLARVKDFHVIARNSAFAYKGRSIDVREVGRQLGVRYAVEGSVRRVGERVRITAQLVETDTGAHIWSSRVDGRTADLFELQDKMAAEVASAAQPSIRQAEIDRVRLKKTEALTPYDLVMRALPHLWDHKPEGIVEARELLRRALELDPNYGRAAAMAAWIHGQKVAYNLTTDNAAERAEGGPLIELATRTVGDDPMALTVLGTAMMQIGGDIEQATELVGRALKLDPNLAWAWMRHGFGLTFLGRPEDGLASFTRARELSPLDPFVFNIHAGTGMAHFAAGRVGEALVHARRAMAERPGLSWLYRDLAVYYAHQGDLAAAADSLARFLTPRPPVDLVAVGDSLRFMFPSLLARYLQGLKLAGMR